MKCLRALWKEILNKRYHLLSFIILVSLTSLVAWWSVFIRSAIIYQYRSQLENLQITIRYHSLYLGLQTIAPEPGIFADDERLIIIPCEKSQYEIAEPLQPHWPQLCLEPSHAYINDIEHNYRNKTIMVFGESGFLILILLISVLLLARMIWLERRANRELNEIWSRITHEIKTPITGIKAFLQTLQTQSFSKEELEPLLNLALQQIDRQEQLMENVLIGRRLEKRGAGLDKSIFEIGHFVDHFFSSKQLLLKGKDLVIRKQYTGQLCVQADPDAVRVILDNITDNAVKYSLGELELLVEIKDINKYAVISLKDNGPGFSPQMADKIFEAFKRLKDELPQQPNGTGMGLHISRQLARKMGGDLTAESHGQKSGATFSLKLTKIEWTRENDSYNRS